MSRHEYITCDRPGCAADSRNGAQLTRVVIDFPYNREKLFSISFEVCDEDLRHLRETLQAFLRKGVL